MVWYGLWLCSSGSDWVTIKVMKIEDNTVEPPFITEVNYRGVIDLLATWPTSISFKCLPPVGIPSGSLFPWVLWSLWKARNSLVFEGFSASPEDTLTSAIKLAREWCLDSKPEKGQGKKGKRTVTQEASGSDVAWNEERRIAGLGWTILEQDRSRQFQSHVEFVASPLMAEALALRDAVLPCKRLKMKTVRFELDSAQLVKCCNLELVLVELHSITADILSFAEAFETVSFVWIPRDLNGEADGLAKEALFVGETDVVVVDLNAPN